MKPKKKEHDKCYVGVDCSICQDCANKMIKEAIQSERKRVCEMLEKWKDKIEFWNMEDYYIFRKSIKELLAKINSEKTAK